MIFWIQILSEELFEGLDFKIFLGEHACSQIHGPIPLMGLLLLHNIANATNVLQTDYILSQLLQFPPQTKISRWNPENVMFFYVLKSGCENVNHENVIMLNYIIYSGRSGHQCVFSLS